MATTKQMKEHSIVLQSSSVSSNIREELSSLIHDQWVHWTTYMLNNMTPENVERWSRQIKTPYEALSEKEKDSDREWADKFLKLLFKI